MSRFIISRGALGVRFLLKADNGRTLAVSKYYATLDACKKGICSLTFYAPIAPLVDATVGEYGANPKFEITKGESGGYCYALKSANGKKRAVLRPDGNAQGVPARSRDAAHGRDGRRGRDGYVKTTDAFNGEGARQRSAKGLTKRPKAGII